MGGTSHNQDLGKDLLLVYQLAIIVSLCECWPQVRRSLQTADVGRSLLARLIDTVNWLAARPNHSLSPTLVVSNFPLTMNIFVLGKREPGPFLPGTQSMNHLDLRPSLHDGCFDCTVSRLNTLTHCTEQSCCKVVKHGV